MIRMIIVIMISILPMVSPCMQLQKDEQSQ